MSLLYFDPLFQEHQTGQHPENARRLITICNRISSSPLLDSFRRPEWSSADVAELALIHDAEYLAELQAYCQQGGGRIEQDTVVSSLSYDVACRAAGGVADGVRRIVAGEAQRAFCAVRPPGHHARRSQAMGFCLLGNAALGACVATRLLGLNRVLIVDWDVHHGNGTQEMFWEDPQVGFYSIHRWPFYPGTGSAAETGSGPGLGTTCNVPVNFGVSRQEYLRLFESTLTEFAAKIRPEFILISAGFDAHVQDPIGSLGLESDDFRDLTDVVVGLADEYAGGRILSTLEGGYHPVSLAESVELHLAALIADR